MTRQNSLIASFLILVATCAWPASAQDSSNRDRVGSRTNTGQSPLRRAAPRSQPRLTNSGQAQKGQAQSGHARRGQSAATQHSHAGHQHAAHSRVTQASGEMVIDDGETVYGEPMMESMDEGNFVSDHGASTCDGNCMGGCDSCGNQGMATFGQENYCNTCNTPRRFCICLPTHGWAHAEYLLWFQKGMSLPPLVTTSAVTTRGAAGVLPGGGVLYGGDSSALDGSRSGGRIRFGTWFDRFPGVGLEGEYFGLGERTESFFQQSTGTPILARPFFNVATGLQDAELVAFPNVLSGSVGVDVTSELNGAAARFRRTLCCSSGSAYSPFCRTTVPTSSRLDCTMGYRYYGLKESLTVRERLQSTVTASPGSFDITDRVDTRNQFNGGEVGVIWQGRRGLWSLDKLMRVGIGNNLQTVTIGGRTTTVENGTTTNYTTGILAQRSNSGTYDRNNFAMIPELGLTLGYQLSRRVRLTAGYSLIYWGNVARPGDQVSLDVNPNLFPPESNPLTGALRPQFQFASSDYWVQGMSFGADIRW